MKRLLIILLALFAFPAHGADLENLLKRIRLPTGFQIEVWANIPGARSLAFSDELNAVLVGTRRDSIFAIAIAPDGSAGKVIKLLSGLKVPNGITWYDGAIYVAEQHRVIRLPGHDFNDLINARPETVFDDLPDKGWHGKRYITVGPDEMLYVTVGSPCNVCWVEGLEGTIIRIDPQDGSAEIFATGIRNSVGMDFHPETGELHFTDNGADFMGDNLPPDELNRAPRQGMDFGFPYYGGGDTRTSKYYNTPPLRPATMPDLRFKAHVAALGIRFYQGDQFPADYQGNAFVAHHGSWNRSIPDGYRVARVRFDEQGRAVSWRAFAEGWLYRGKAWGRPVDVEALPDGSLLVSDDKQGAIYRISYSGD